MKQDFSPLTLRSDAAGAAFRPLWSDTAPTLPALPALRGRESASIVIIGAGFSGLSTAIHLAEHGASVVVLEAEEPGAGGSGASGGQVHPGLRHYRHELQAAFGTEPGGRLFDYAAGIADRTFALIARLGIACDAGQGGWVQLADTEEKVAETKRRVESWYAHGAPVRPLDVDEIEALVGTRAYRGGWIHQSGGTVQPLSLARGLAAAAQQRGVKIFARTPAESFARNGVGWRVQTEAGSVEAEKLLLAHNLDVRDVSPSLQAMTLPVWSFQTATAPLDRAANKIPAHGVAVSDLRQIISYFRSDRDGRVVMGGKGTGEPPQGADDFGIQSEMMRRIFPAIAGAPIDYRWGGRVAITVDRLPRIVRLGPNAYATLGCNGKGVAWTTALGAPLAETLLTGHENALPLPVTALAPIPFYRFRRAYVAAGTAWLRLKDSLGLTGSSP